MSRLILMSNRLPITVKVADGKLEVHEAVGGLSTAVEAARLGASSTSWIGWPGDTSGARGALRKALTDELSQRGLRGVELSRREVSAYYEGFSNGILWPVLHDRIDRVPIDSEDSDFKVYESVNQRFADEALHVVGSDDDLWVHDFQLLLVPQQVRAQRPHARVGFFLHVPFPSPDIFAVLPWRAALLEGMLGADLVGFHTEQYQASFLATVARVLGLVVRGHQVLLPSGRRVTTGAFPLGVDLPAYEADASHAVEQQMVRLREEHGSRTLLLGVDRLDYTKGITRRLLAMERLLEQRPDLRGHITLLQVAVPSRQNVEAYADLRRQLDALVGRINGKFSSLSGPVPVRYLTRSFAPLELVALYRAADVMVVTPVRDGMNLVAKEFVAARIDGDGVLVLSEFAGAAQELEDAVLVNPYDTEGTAAAIGRAIDMPAEERRRRMTAMRGRLQGSTPQTWSASFLAALHRAAHERVAVEARETA